MSTISVEHAVRLVIDEMHVYLGQDLTLDDMARTAMFSKFHFTRVFREVTGTSPRRFLSALRMQEAKHLLVNTECSVADISSQVGYSSVGTFSSRFKSCVGVSPSRYRELDGNGTALHPEASPATTSNGTRSSLSLRGRIVLPGDRALGQVFVGLFPGSIPQGRPVRHTLMNGPGLFELQDVPPGTWYVLAHSVPYGTEAPDGGLPGGPDLLSVGRYGPVSVRPGVLAMPADIVLHPAGPLDPPVLIALPGENTGAAVPAAA